ncbi:CAP domain-containing protein [Kineothrix sp. MB12-C1]|uniref:CAP domain-containing protein n=1 Tax=Kineothrix sp. MB12-C1 TaxID=3070215 RepID=UPI0027D22DA8|nr:CAP domain-containing protein [Kineothrix sp. MB12-C1]WMC92692.1 CAP domain-containing protein [Kineothrix sp. MB12-C1]WMC92735.1 CAP domain-containing protein [Kineothrix sp. MB12-C1]
MNLLPSLLVATTIIGGGSFSSNACPDTSQLQNQLQNQLNSNRTTQQTIVGSASDLESILNQLGVDASSIKDCLPETTQPEANAPDIKVPGTGTETPNINTPDCDIKVPDTNTPDSGTKVPDTNTPDSGTKNPGTNTPDSGTKAPDTNTPDSGTKNPGTSTPDNSTKNPGTNTPDSGTKNPGTNTPDSGTKAPDTNTPGNGGSNSESNANKSYVEQVLDLVNAEREKAGLSALTMKDDLNAAALIRAKETTQSFSHTRPNGTSFATVLKENNISYRTAGENIAWGQSTPEEVVTAWMNSEGHRANILNKSFTSIGVGYYVSNNTPYWSQLFTA